jgi:hypothetical protein
LHVTPLIDPEKLFALLDAFYPVPQGKTLRRTPYLPYLSYAPSAWLLPLKFTGGGLSAPGKIMFDAEGNAWTGVNFIVGSQASDDLWDGNLSKFAPSGKPRSPPTTGFQGGGIEGPGFGTAVDADGGAWVTSTGSKTISHFDKNGQPLSPPEGYNFGGQLGTMQGIIVAPNGDVWAVDFEKDQVVHLPKGDASKAEFFCRSADGKSNKDSPCKLNAPFHLAIDPWLSIAIPLPLCPPVGNTSTLLGLLAERRVTMSPRALVIQMRSCCWKQFRVYFVDAAPGRSGGGGASLLEGVGSNAAPMNGYPKVFNIEADPHEDYNIGEIYNFVLGPVLHAVGEYKASVARNPNPPAANMTRF